MRDPYEVLGVTKGASAKDVKQAYRKLARDLHPDLHPGDTAAEDRFKDVAAAYDFLSDDEKKARYDRGEIDASGAPKAERQFYRQYAETGPGGMRYSNPGDFFRDFENADVFSDLFRGSRRGQRMTQGADIRAQVQVDFLDAVNGATRELSLPGGRKLKVTIPPGTEDSQVLRLKGQGEPAAARGEPGDLHLEIKVTPHTRFKREGNDIHLELPLTLGEAVLGGKIDVPTVDGTVNLKIPKGANSGMRMRIRGKGVASRGNEPRGDQYVTLQVMLPETVDPELEDFVRTWSEAHPYQPRQR